MNKLKWASIINNTKLAISKHSPEILTGIGIAGMITTTVLAVKATPKALRHIEVEEESKGDALTPVEVVKACWKDYIPAAVTGVASTACLIGASSVNAKRNTALATAYKLSETALAEYKEKVVETIGEKKEEAIKQEVAKSKLEKNPVNTSEVIITEKGNTRFFDPISGRRFISDIDKIRKIENELNKNMLQDMFGYVSLNEFYDEIGLDRVAVGDELGWNVSKGLIDIHFSAQIDEDETPCIVLDYLVAPKYNYDRYS